MTATTGTGELSDRDVGWLRYLYGKATTPDSWDKESEPHEHWDNISTPPMLCFHRFDLIDSTYAIALMADVTPAWREVYGRILDEMIFRHTGWWAAYDWLTFLGHDPDRGNYPEFYKFLIPQQVWGEYDAPGWTANGIEPWGLQMDPIGATGNLFFKGFFLVMLGLHLRTTGNERWNQPFDMVRDGENTFSWFHSKIAEHLYNQWLVAPDGCHCENTKVWPFCLAGAGLGLQLHDLLRGTEYHSVFRSWWTDTCRTKYLHLDEEEIPVMTTFYYDPILDIHHEMPGASMLPVSYLAPQVPDEALRLFKTGMERMGMWEPRPPLGNQGDRGAATNLWMAKEFGNQALVDALNESVDAYCEPTWDTGRGEFTWGFNLNEPHPRGQYNGTMAAAQVATKGSWWRLANVGPGDRFTEPTVVDVDFPTVALREARWDAKTSTLTVTPVGIAPDAGRTSMRVINVGGPGEWRADGPVAAEVAVRAVDGGLEVDMPVRGERVLLRGPVAGR